MKYGKSPKDLALATGDLGVERADQRHEPIFNGADVERHLVLRLQPIQRAPHLAAENTFHRRRIRAGMKTSAAGRLSFSMQRV